MSITLGSVEYETMRSRKLSACSSTALAAPRKCCTSHAVSRCIRCRSGCADFFGCELARTDQVVQQGSIWWSLRPRPISRITIWAGTDGMQYERRTVVTGLPGHPLLGKGKGLLYHRYARRAESTRGGIEKRGIPAAFIPRSAHCLLSIVSKNLVGTGSHPPGTGNGHHFDIDLRRLANKPPCGGRARPGHFYNILYRRQDSHFSPIYPHTDPRMRRNYRLML